MRVWVGLLFFALWTIAMMAGLSTDIPHWLQMAGWILVSAYLLGSSFYILLRSKSDRHQNCGEVGLLSPRLRRWVLDEQEPKSKA
jgi:hypothetical protein